MHAFQAALPIDHFQSLSSVDDLLALIEAEVGDYDSINPVLSRLMLETMRQAERDLGLREQMGALLGGYHKLMIRTVRADQTAGAVFDGASVDAIATLLGAVGDGLLLRALLDPDLDVHAAVDA